MVSVTFLDRIFTPRCFAFACVFRDLACYFYQVVGRRRHPDATYWRLGRVVAEGRLEGARNRPRRSERQHPASPGGMYVSSNMCNRVATIVVRQEVVGILSEREKRCPKGYGGVGWAADGIEACGVMEDKSYDPCRI